MKMSNPPDAAGAVQPGLYQHFKGGLYRVHGVMRNATNGAGYEPMVYYEALVKDGAPFADEWESKVPAGHFVRRLAEFTEEVAWPDGSVGPRWKRVE
jgi:hypothetical protein